MPVLMPLFFQAHSGVVHFLGRPLSEFGATRAHVGLRVAALDAPSGSEAEKVFALAKEQAAQAIAEARTQRRAA
jgi:hypothetical protein